MALMPAFHRRKQNAASVGRLVAGYGELEFLLAWCAGTALACQTSIKNGKTAAQHRMAGEHEGVRRIFSIRGESKRIGAAKRLIRPAAINAGLQNDYIGWRHSNPAFAFVIPSRIAIGTSRESVVYSLSISKRQQTLARSSQ